jgi:hypothetical protein
LTAGTVLAVYPPASASQNADPIGHVAITVCGTLDSEVEPVAYEGFAMVPREDLPDGGVCETLVVHYDEHLRIGIAVDGVDASGNAVPAEELESITTGLQELADRPGSWLRVVDLQDDPEWVLAWREDGLHIVSTCAADQADDAALAQAAFERGPAPAGVDAIDWLSSILDRIVHAQNLRRIASLNEGIGLAGVPCEITIQRQSPTGGEHDDGSGAIRPQHLPGVLEISISNPNDFAIDVTLLYIDADFGVSIVYPRPGRDDIRLPAHSARPRPFQLELTDAPVGVESLIAIVMPGEGQAISFDMLTRESIAESVAMRDAERLVDTPLGAFLRDATYQVARDGAVTQPVESNYSMQIFTWEVIEALPETATPGRAD